MRGMPTWYRSTKKSAYLRRTEEAEKSDSIPLLYRITRTTSIIIHCRASSKAINAANYILFFSFALKRLWTSVLNEIIRGVLTVVFQRITWTLFISTFKPTLLHRGPPLKEPWKFMNAYVPATLFNTVENFLTRRAINIDEGEIKARRQRSDRSKSNDLPFRARRNEKKTKILPV